MSPIKNISLAFACRETLNKGLFCNKCSHRVIDFKDKTHRDLQQHLETSDRRVCGIFKKSQLSEQFLRYAAATFVATSMTFPGNGQDLKEDSSFQACEKIETQDEEEFFLGVIVDIPAEPIGGYKNFFDAIRANIKVPPSLNEAGKTFLEFTVTTDGQVRNVKVIKGFNSLADREAARVLSTLNIPFAPGRQRGKPVEAKLVIPIAFDPGKR